METETVSESGATEVNTEEVERAEIIDVCQLETAGGQSGEEESKGKKGEGAERGHRGAIHWEGEEESWGDAALWMFIFFRKMMHRKERQGEAQVDGTTGGGGGGNSGGLGDGHSSGGGAGGVAGPSNVAGGLGSGSGTRSGGQEGEGRPEAAEEVDQFGYPDSPTQNWLAAHADLSPLRILDNINLKSEFPYSVSMDTEKPPDISNIGLDTATNNLLQFAASVPVPDHTTTFLDIGLDSFQSLYEDQLMGDLAQGATVTTMTTVATPSILEAGTFTKVTELGPGQVDLRSLGLQSVTSVQCVGPPGQEAIMAHMTPVTAPLTLTPQPPALKSLVEPLPASALQGLIKIEPNFDTSLVKVEEAGTCDTSLDSCYEGASSPGGGKIKTPSARKKSTASTDTDNEEDISNIPSLNMRLQIIQQRVSSSLITLHRICYLPVLLIALLLHFYYTQFHKDFYCDGMKGFD